MRRTEHGAVLLEVLAALAILGLAGLALLELVAGHLEAVATARERERELWDEERLLVAHALLSATDLDRRLGARAAGPYIVSIQRPERELYRIAVGRRTAPGMEDLVTVVYRRESEHGP
jgi:hypothetical protein